MGVWSLIEDKYAKCNQKVIIHDKCNLYIYLKLVSFIKGLFSSKFFLILAFILSYIEFYMFYEVLESNRQFGVILGWNKEGNPSTGV